LQQDYQLARERAFSHAGVPFALERPGPPVALVPMWVRVLAHLT
jgi:hypothetical protein